MLKVPSLTHLYNPFHSKYLVFRTQYAKHLVFQNFDLKYQGMEILGFLFEILRISKICSNRIPELTFSAKSTIIEFLQGPPLIMAY